MEFVTLSSLSGLLALGVPIGMLALFLWSIIHTESRHVLRFRIWRLLHGKGEISDEGVNEYVNEQNSLMTFRLIAGVPVQSLDRAHELIRWTCENQVEMYELRMAGKHFDPDKRVIKTEGLPGKISQALKLLAAALAVPIVFGCAWLVYTDSALLSLKATQRHFWMTGTEARVAWPLLKTPLRQSACSGDLAALAKQTSFTVEEAGIICGVLKDEKTPSYTKQQVADQWKSALLLLLEILFIAWLLLSSFVGALVAHRLALRNLDPQLDGQQLPLNLQ